MAAFCAIAGREAVVLKASDRPANAGFCAIAGREIVDVSERGRVVGGAGVLAEREEGLEAAGRLLGILHTGEKPTIEKSPIDRKKCCFKLGRILLFERNISCAPFEFKDSRSLEFKDSRSPHRFGVIDKYRTNQVPSNRSSLYKACSKCRMMRSKMCRRRCWGICSAW